MCIVVQSARPIDELDIKKIRYIIRFAKDPDVSLFRLFPKRFKSRNGETIYFDGDKRPKITKIEVNENGNF